MSDEMRGRERGKLLSTAQVAELLGVREYTVRRWCHDGLIEFHRMGSAKRPVLRIFEADLDAYIERTRQPLERPAEGPVEVEAAPAEPPRRRRRRQT